MKYNILSVLGLFTDKFLYIEDSYDLYNPMDTGQWWLPRFYTIKATKTRYADDFVTGEKVIVSEYWCVGRGVFSGWWILYEAIS